MNKRSRFFGLFLGLAMSSCQCSRQDFKEYEGEYYGKVDSKVKFVDEDNDKTITDTCQEKEIDKDDSSLALPVMKDNSNSIILRRKAYTLSYNVEMKNPNWVAWYLSAAHVDGEWARSNDYREDFDVPSPRATNDDYRGSTWSRGHMCPAGDNKWDSDAMSETFLLSNMCPQDRNLNSGLWNRVETDCRKWAQKYGGIYIVCGPLYYNKEHETIGDNNVVVPEAFYKVVLCMEGRPKAIGFIVKNNAGTKKKDQYVNSVDEVERITGIDFFSGVPDDIEDEIEANANIRDW